MSVQRVRLELDSNTHRSSNGTALFGGSPFRMVRVSKTGAELLDGWLSGELVDLGELAPEPASLAGRLLAAGMVHPSPEPVSDSEDRVGVVVPVYDDTAGLAVCLAAVRAELPEAPIVVVDDASPASSAATLADLAAAHGAELVRHDVNRGPGPARNTGAQLLATQRAGRGHCGGGGGDIVLFCDSDVALAPGSVGLLMAHFNAGVGSADSVAAVAPRVAARPGLKRLDRYEQVASPLDMGPSPGLVRPGAPLSYVPSTVLAVRFDAFAAVGGFEESLRVGEDVDLIWRLAGDPGCGSIRYEPRALAHHRNRASWPKLVRQRYSYGRSAAALDRLHPGDVAPVRLPASTMAGWALAWLGGRRGAVTGLGLAAWEARRLHRHLAGSLDRPGDQPRREVARLIGKSHGHAGRWLAQAVARVWLPGFVAAAIVSRRARRVLLAAQVLPPLLRWWRDRPALDPVTFVAAQAGEAAAYGVGVVTASVTTNPPTLRTILPRQGK